MVLVSSMLFLNALFILLFFFVIAIVIVVIVIVFCHMQKILCKKIFNRK